MILMCAGLCVCSCMDLRVKVHFLHSGKVTLIWANVLSGMSHCMELRVKTELYTVVECRL